jgi:hypothetical protein
MYKKPHLINKGVGAYRNLAQQHLNALQKANTNKLFKKGMFREYINKVHSILEKKKIVKNAWIVESPPSPRVAPESPPKVQIQLNKHVSSNSLWMSEPWGQQVQAIVDLERPLDLNKAFFEVLKVGGDIVRVVARNTQFKTIAYKDANGIVGDLAGKTISRVDLVTNKKGGVQFYPNGKVIILTTDLGYIEKAIGPILRGKKPSVQNTSGWITTNQSVNPEKLAELLSKFAQYERELNPSYVTISLGGRNKGTKFTLQFYLNGKIRYSGFVASAAQSKEFIRSIYSDAKAAFKTKVKHSYLNLNRMLKSAERRRKDNGKNHPSAEEIQIRMAMKKMAENENKADRKRRKEEEGKKRREVVPVPEDFNGVCPDGMYCRPNAKGQPVCYKMPDLSTKRARDSARTTCLTAYKKAGVKIPEKIRKLFALPENAVNAANKPNSNGFNIGNNNIFRIKKLECGRYSKPELEAMARKHGILIPAYMPPGGKKKYICDQLRKKIKPVNKPASASSNNKGEPNFKFQGVNMYLKKKAGIVYIQQGLKRKDQRHIPPRACHTIQRDKLELIAKTLGIKNPEKYLSRKELCQAIGGRTRNNALAAEFENVLVPAKPNSIMNKMNLIPTKPNGNCFYEALIKVTKSKADIETLRRRIARQINKDMTNEEAEVTLNGRHMSKAEFIEYVKRDKSWAGQRELKAASDLFNINIITLSPTGKRLELLSFDEKPNRPVFYLRYDAEPGEAGSHFEGLAPKAGVSPIVPPRRRPGRPLGAKAKVKPTKVASPSPNKVAVGNMNAAQMDELLGI